MRQGTVYNGNGQPQAFDEGPPSDLVEGSLSLDVKNDQLRGVVPLMGSSR
ncbi:MAG: hypothetical protein ACM3VX_05355 [Bacteroidota bacterium]